jgi:hypothetical protein
VVDSHDDGRYRNPEVPDGAPHGALPGFGFRMSCRMKCGFYAGNRIRARNEGHAQESSHQ